MALALRRRWRFLLQRERAMGLFFLLLGASLSSFARTLRKVF